MIMLRHTKPDAPEGLCYGRLDLAPAEGFCGASGSACARTAARVARCYITAASLRDHGPDHRHRARFAP